LIARARPWACFLKPSKQARHVLLLRPGGVGGAAAGGAF
jgi:hypothetical protein